MILPLETAFSYNDLFKIESSYPFSASFSSSYLYTLQQIINDLIPESILEGASDKKSIFSRLAQLLPLVKYPSIINHLQPIPITFLYPSAYTHGAGRYIGDTVSRWLVPGKQLAIVARISLNIRFSAYPILQFYLLQEMFLVQDLEDLPSFRKNLSPLLEKIRINVKAVHEARYIASLKGFSSQNKESILRTNLSPLFKQNEGLFHQIHSILTSLDAEEKIDEINKNISLLFETRPKIFDREVFNEIAQHSLFLGSQFSSERDASLISRIIAYQYLFKKVLQEKMEKFPSKRHVSFKILKRGLKKNPSILPLLFGFNFLKEQERFEVRHFREALQHCFSDLEWIPNSLIIDRRHEKLQLFYVEIKKKDGSPFVLSEIKQVSQKLPEGLVRRIENGAHPFFMPRNDEELLRNLVVLSQQIKRVGDLPQVSIHCDIQPERDLTFTVLIVRLLRKGSSPLEKALQRISQLKVEFEDIREMLPLKKRYPREAAILRMTLEREPFFRSDYSIDFLQARQKVASALTSAIGEFRDFNGGIILKQEEALSSLKKALSLSTSQERTLLDNYFHSLRPTLMQAIHETSVLKDHFQLLQKLFKKRSPSLEVYTGERNFFCFMKGVSLPFKEKVLSAATTHRISLRDLTTSSFQVDQEPYLGFILPITGKKEAHLFEKAIRDALQQRKLSLRVNSDDAPNFVE